MKNNYLYILNRNFARRIFDYSEIFRTFATIYKQLNLMKRILSTLSLVAFFAANIYAQAPRFRFQKNEEKRYTLKVGDTTMEIDANNGARIVSLKSDTTEILSQINMPNMYGSTFWTSPQKEWNWPPVYEHDMAPYEVALLDNAIVMTSPLSEKIPLRISKRFEAEPASNSFLVTYTIKNEGTVDRKVAPWEISRVLARGYVYFDADPAKIWPAGLMDFKLHNGLAWYKIDHVEGQNRKVNADGKGWLAYTYNGLYLIKHFLDLNASQPAPGEAEIQVYVHQGNAYVELESQGEYTNLKPGQSLSWAVRWFVRRL